MAQRFIACDREQSFLMAPDVRDWLPEDHFAWFVLEAVESMVLDAFYAGYRADGRSRPAFDPAMMVALILYAYARGNRSSRAIERACVEDVAYRVLAAQQKPDHATLARFVERHQEALAGVFGSVLGLCARAGLVGVNVVAVDGSKISANASREATADYERLAREILEEAIEVDAAEDERFGDRRGDELPPELATSMGRREWFKAARRWLDDERAEQAAIARDRPERVKEASAGWTSSSGRRCAPRRPISATGPRASIAAAAGSAPTPSRGPTCRRRSWSGRSTPPIWIPTWSRASTAGCGATTRKPPATSTG